MTAEEARKLSNNTPDKNNAKILEAIHNQIGGSAKNGSRKIYHFLPMPDEVRDQLEKKGYTVSLSFMQGNECWIITW